VKPEKRVYTSAVILLLFCIGSVLIYFPTIRRGFVSDDFLVMKRVGVDKVIWIKGFFRPLADLLLYCSYRLHGLAPAGYYLFNILLHGISSFLLLRLCLLWKWTEDADRQRSYALLAALLFLFYPFHNECIVWVLGRGSLAANMLGLGALLAVVSGLPERKKIFWCCVCYFAGMAGYESVLLVPLMVLVILLTKGVRMMEYARWGLALGITLGIHLVLRVVVSGTLTGDYGGGFFQFSPAKYGGNVFKVLGRLFLPPMNDSRLMVLLFVLVMGGLLAGFFLFFRKYRDQPGKREYLIKLFLLIVIACVVPVLAGVSSHTSESDRFLYFPSYFLCAGGAFLLVNMVRRKWLPAAMVVLLCYEGVFLEKNNWNWIKASAIANDVLGTVLREKTGNKLFIVNLPDELDGAYIFRLGLPDALLMNGRDTSGLVIVNHLRRDVEVRLPDSLIVEEKVGELVLGPGVIIRRGEADSFRITGVGGVQTMQGREKAGAYTWLGGKDDVVLYWNRKRLLKWVPGGR